MLELILNLLLLALATGVGTAGALYLAIWYLRRPSQPSLVPIAGGSLPSSDDVSAVRCRACDTLISAKARRCPHCTSSL